MGVGHQHGGYDWMERMIFKGKRWDIYGVFLWMGNTDEKRVVWNISVIFIFMDW